MLLFIRVKMYNNRITKEILKNKVVNFNKLAGFGFVKDGQEYFYKTNLMDNQFLLTVIIDMAGNLKTKVEDVATNDEYTLFLLEGVTGAFVGKVKAEYEDVIINIANSCYECEIFKTTQAKQIIEYVKTKYGDELEFLWKDSPNTAIVRRKETKKWYILLFCESKSKLGVDSHELVEILNLHMKTEEIEKVIDYNKYYPGYHMNKKHWVSICLDGTLTWAELQSRIDDSYKLAKK